MRNPRNQTAPHPGYDTGSGEQANTAQGRPARTREPGDRCDYYADEVISIYRDFPDGPPTVYGVTGEDAIRAAAVAEYLSGGWLEFGHVLGPYDE